MLDLNTFDHVENMVYYDPNSYFNQEEYTEYKEVIFNQLRDLNNLGQDIIKELNIEDNIKYKLFLDIIEFVNNNYLNLPDKDNILNNTQLEITATLLYQFLCVDCFNIIIPNMLESLNIQNINQFDKIISRPSETSVIKKLFLNTISEILISLERLKNLDHTVADRDDYKNLVNRFGNYLENIDFCDEFKFIENYLRPLLNKNFEQLMWRTL